MMGIHYIGLLILFSSHVHCNITATWMTTPMTIKTPRPEFTDIPSHMVDDAMNLDVGRFVPMREEFQYHNDQDRLLEQRPLKIGTMPCWYQYTRCIRNLRAYERRCALNFNVWYGYIPYANYCDIFFENCRRGYRVWRIIALGKCIYDRHHIVYEVQRFEGK